MIIRQLNNSERNNGESLSPYDFVISGEYTKRQGYLHNRRGNGWQFNYDTPHTKFILELVL